MRTTQKILVGAGALAAGLVTRQAGAQLLDVNPPLPNILLLVDTSGSMDYQIDGSKVACEYVDPSLASEPKWTSGGSIPSKNQSRWSQLVQVLTGDVNNYACYTQDRSSTSFVNEYTLSGTAPYDKGYYVPFHRMLSGTCTIGPGTLNTSSAFAWDDVNDFYFHKYDVPGQGGGGCASLSQTATGLLDSFVDRARFALMTFDPLTDPGTGVTAPAAPNYATGTAGMWSYYLGDFAKGRPGGCATTPYPAMEVGARNAGAPPWEGRLVPFGDPDASLAVVAAQNRRIQNVLLAMRPYGATPINGMLADARDFLLNDGSADLSQGLGTSCASNGVGCLGPKFDPKLSGGCRKSYVILLTDGEENLNLRPDCAKAAADPSAAGVCPYPDTSDVIAKKLADENDTETFVVGFAVSSIDGVSGQAQPVDCSKISSETSFDPDGLCSEGTMDPRLSACCALAKIAWNGGTTNAYFATDINGLRSALSGILSKITSATTTRTLPVFASGSASGDSTSYSFLSSFYADAGHLWRGVLERRRIVCEPELENGVQVVKPIDKEIDPALGDDFGENLNSNAGAARRYYTVIRAKDLDGNVKSERSIRQNLSGDPDGVNAIGGSLTSGNDSNFSTQLTAEVMNVAKTICDGDHPTTGPEECAHRIMDWEIGVAPTITELPSRAEHKLGDIYHSTPAVVTVPNDHLRDESYIAFADQQKLRPLILYTATNDGQLHAFKVNKNAADSTDTFAVNSKENNELWSFFPPAVLPYLASQYWSTHQQLLDGIPIVKDVVFERSQGNAEAGTGTWHTVLVASFGRFQGGYYALDITNPVPKSEDANTGPKLLWQLTTDDAGKPLFGAHGGTPSITTLYFQDEGADEAKEYAVAILPGGDSDGPTTYNTTCAARAGDWKDAVDSSDFEPRKEVNCYTSTAARSVTIVRLSDGKIIRSFRRQGDPMGSLKTDVVTDTEGKYAPIDSPMTGQPVVFPATTGAVAQRAFIGDRDGSLWRMDFSSTNPKKWTIGLFFDAYAGKSATAGQPIATPPIVSVDEIGNLTLSFSTGDQETFTSDPNMANFAWSVRENAAKSYQAEPVWFVPFANGERVTGPMSIFNSTLYFSTFLPNQSASNACSSGLSKLWGVDYLRRIDDTEEPSAANGPLGRLVTDMVTNDSLKDPVASQDLGQEYIVFGVGIRQKPSCLVEETYTDPYLGFGTHFGASSVTPGEFELVVQTGAGSSPSKAKTNTLSTTLPTPPATTRIDSWAAVVE